jgi:hypothetical protein
VDEIWSPVLYYTQSSFKRNGNKRNEYLGVRKKWSTRFFWGKKKRKKRAKGDSNTKCAMENG